MGGELETTTLHQKDNYKIEGKTASRNHKAKIKQTLKQFLIS